MNLFRPPCKSPSSHCPPGTQHVFQLKAVEDLQVWKSRPSWVLWIQHSKTGGQFMWQKTVTATDLYLSKGTLLSHSKDIWQIWQNTFKQFCLLLFHRWRYKAFVKKRQTGVHIQMEPRTTTGCFKNLLSAEWPSADRRSCTQEPFHKFWIRR